MSVSERSTGSGLPVARIAQMAKAARRKGIATSPVCATRIQR